MDTKFTVEESNLISIFLDGNNYFDLGNRLKVMEGVRGAIPYIKDTALLEIAMKVLERLKNMSDEEFIRNEFIAAD